MRDSPTVFAVRRLVTPGAAVLAAVLVAACNDGGGGSTEAFCATLEEEAEALMNPALMTQADVAAYVELHEKIGERVPLAIEEDWSVYADALGTAAAVVPGDAEAAERARRDIYAAEESAFRVKDWVAVNCGFDLSSFGPVARLNPAVTTTTIAATTTSTPATTAAATTTTASAGSTTTTRAPSITVAGTTTTVAG